MAARSASGARGFAFLEVMVGILIFALGILGLAGMQAVSARNSTDAKYRSEAMLLANHLIGEMWVSDRTISVLQTRFATGGTDYATWLANVAATLPGVVADTTTAPTVAIDDDGVVNVALYWITPGAAADSALHNLTVVAQIR